MPALIGGYFGVKSGQGRLPVFTAGLAGIAMFGFYLGTSLFHLYTIVVAYEVSGFGAALATSATAPMAELYWFIQSWRIAGYITNFYDMLFLLLIGLLVFGVTMMGVAEQRASRASQSPEHNAV